MQAKFMSYVNSSSDERYYSITVDEELMRILTPETLHALKQGQDVRLHNYVADAAQYSYRLKELRDALTVIATQLFPTPPCIK